ncbi:MAG: UDP-N-acetylglucosamine 1-carboxyvinyltransferase [Oscillospiraceae bacterium]|jgi:UDP-N-acetylglucosamine 1-carboxyvinyltransferase|nr:UDP-N-acetylglucosamine 1-carboxyvinyltransferase [Oscillospiraceae bacterium]
MSGFRISTSPPLHGEVSIHTAKNSVLPILAACLLTNEQCSILSTPRLTDVLAMQELLEACGAECEWDGTTFHVKAEDLTVLDTCAKKSEQGSAAGATEKSTLSPAAVRKDDAMRRMRASILIMGPLLARLGTVRVSLPGGCAIGQRPIDQHLKGMIALGATVSQEQGCIELSGKLKGASIYLDMPSVGATENIMMAAVTAAGLTRIENAAKEPEIVDLSMFLNAMGAHISFAGTGTILIQGVSNLHGVRYQPIPDRIEAGTLACAAAIAGGNILLRGARPEHLRALLYKLQETGVIIIEQRDGIRIRGKSLTPISVRTMYYPGFPTDLQAPLMAVSCYAPGTSVFTETVFENRFMHATELRRLGASIRVEDRIALVEGGKQLYGTKVTSPDLRAGAALIVAAVGAKGDTIVNDPQGHIDRGYENIEETMSRLGVPIVREK